MNEYISRELSFISFNGRVLEEASREDNPLLERGKFLSICESNLDEFFMVRVGGLMRAMSAGENRPDISGLTPPKQLAKIRARVRAQIARQYEIMMVQYLPALQKAGFFLLSINELDREQSAWLSSYFDREVLPLLTPRAIDPKCPFPLLAARCLHLALLLTPAAGSVGLRFALLPLPQSLPRVVLLPMGAGRARGVLVENVVAAFAARLFGNTAPIVCQPFRLTRNTDFFYNDSDADALIIEMRKSLKKRKWGQVVRMEVPANFDSRLMTRLRRYLDVADDDVYPISGPINPSFFMKQLSSLPGFDSLLFPPFAPRIDPRIRHARNIFAAIRDGELFFYHPYDSFDPVIRLLSEAAEDENVLAIKQTLYRVSGKSPIVAALSRAAKNGKQVTALIEVRARFDEENNINWCLALEKAGCHVVYGVPGLKTHSKITLVVRREQDRLRRYVHLSTGNYNDVTARLYTDMGLMTCDEAIGRDAGSFFNMVTGYPDTAPLEKLVAAPYALRAALSRLIGNEMENAEKGLPCGITAKMNALTDRKMIRLLEKAADAGVPVHLIVRGACCLKKGAHENLHVRSIVGRFLEHARVYSFENAGEPLVYLSSADLMTRNLDKRVELMFPIENEAIKARVRGELALELSDNVKAWEMKKSGRYERVPAGEPPVNAQETDILSVDTAPNSGI